ncbi:MAG: multiprotein bridging factor aMBF1 [Thermofilaceae archaeon]|nr:multiprotein bridging factor aMBF1 [Thermofilaceae archaeon]
MRCELCGGEIRGQAYLSVVDRAELILCEKCVKKASKVYGPIGQSKTKNQLSQKRTVSKRERNVVEEVMEDYAEIIREARERMGLTRDALAAILGVKVSVIRRIEEGSLAPTIELAHKIERILRVKLVEKVIEERKGRGEAGAWETTLGDVAVFKEE